MKRYFTEILICSGFLGFSLTLLLYFNLLDAKSSFHEIIIDQNALVDSFNISRLKVIVPILKNIDSLKKRIAILKQDSNAKSPNVKDTAQLKTNIDSLKSNNLQVNSDSDYIKLKDLVALSQDTLRKYRPGKLLTFSNPEQVSNSIYNGPQKSIYYFEFITSDTINKEFPFKKSYPVHVVTSNSNTDFLVKYPSFGLWALGVTTLISDGSLFLSYSLQGFTLLKK